MTSKANFIVDVTVIDPDSGGEVQVSIFKHERGGMFGLDTSYIEQVLDETNIISDPFESFENDIFIPNNGLILLGI